MVLMLHLPFMMALTMHSKMPLWPPTWCPLDANSFTIFEARMWTVQGEVPWNIMPYLYVVETMNRLNT